MSAFRIQIFSSLHKCLCTVLSDAPPTFRTCAGNGSYDLRPTFLRKPGGSKNTVWEHTCTDVALTVQQRQVWNKIVFVFVFVLNNSRLEMY